MRTIMHKVDLCVVGGGLSGVATAISAARHGIRVVLMQDRPVLGGNASSEVRMWICGAHGEDNRECGILEELICENFYLNRARNYSVWDSVLYGAVKREENITLLLNTTCLDAVMDGKRIVSIKGWQLNAETWHIVEATYFADCSGDSILAPLTGAEYRMGREGKDEFGESIAPEVADKKTMGMSCMIQAREMPTKRTFIKPEWAYTYETEEALSGHDHPPFKPLDKCTYWWMEIGGMADSLHDSDACRDELLKIAFGVWDHIKNQGNHGADNWELDWIGFLPGKRESRRYVGRYIVNENDVRSEGKFEDTVAYGGWSMDDHFPEGFYYKHGCSTIWHPAPSPWGIPWRALYAKEIENLLFAGRNISVSHVALSSSRVMATCALLGQAVGTAVSEMCKKGTTPDTIDIPALQALLMNDDCFLPGFSRTVPAVTKLAKCTAEIVRDGIERGEEHLWTGKAGDSVAYTFDAPTEISGIRLVFDSDLNRNWHNMPCGYPLEEETQYLPNTLVRDYQIVLTLADGTQRVIEKKDNYKRFVTLPVGETVLAAELRPLTTWGSSEYRVFDFELY